MKSKATISFKVQLDYELEREILGFDDGMTVLALEALRNGSGKMKQALNKHELNEHKLLQK